MAGDSRISLLPRSGAVQETVGLRPFPLASPLFSSDESLARADLGFPSPRSFEWVGVVGEYSPRLL